MIPFVLSVAVKIGISMTPMKLNFPLMERVIIILTVIAVIVVMNGGNTTSLYIVLQKSGVVINMNKSDDLISRAAARDVINTWGRYKDENIRMNLLHNDLNAIPAVNTIQVVSGRWIYEHDDPTMLPCSVCGYRVFRYNNTRYCPNCGARMDDESHVRSKLLRDGGEEDAW